MGAGGSFVNRDDCATEGEKDKTHACTVSGPQSHVQLWLQLQPPLLFTLAVTMLHGFLVPSWIHISPRRTWR